MNRKPKLLVIGHGRHGKDTLAELLCKFSDLTFNSSSFAAAECFLFDQMNREGYSYESVQECFEDRHNHREYWKKAISDFNTPDRGALCRRILDSNDIYVGMRCHKEYLAVNHLFDMIFLVDATPRVDYIDPTFAIPVYGNQRLIYNHIDLEYLEYQAKEALYELRRKGFNI